MSEQSWLKSLQELFMPKPLLGDLAGAQLWFGEPEPGSNVPICTYADEARSIPNTNPVIADAAGNFGPIFLDMSKPCRGILKNSRGVWLYLVDDARAWCGPIPDYREIVRWKAIEQAARAVIEYNTLKPGEAPGAHVDVILKLCEKLEALRAALESK